MVSGQSDCNLRSQSTALCIANLRTNETTSTLSMRSSLLPLLQMSVTHGPCASLHAFTVATGLQAHVSTLYSALLCRAGCDSPFTQIQMTETIFFQSAFTSDASAHVRRPVCTCAVKLGQPLASHQHVPGCSSARDPIFARCIE